MLEIESRGSCARTKLRNFYGNIYHSRFDTRQSFKGLKIWKSTRINKYNRFRRICIREKMGFVKECTNA